MKNILIILTTFLISGCASDAIRGSASEFGTSVNEAVEINKTQLQAYNNQKNIEANDFYVANKVILNLSAECDVAISGFADSEIIENCKVEPIVEQPELVKRFDATQTQKVATALQDYSTNLATLSGDFKEDSEAFTGALAGIASSIQSLDTAIAQSRGGDIGRLDGEQVSSVTGIINTLGLASLQIRRDQVLVKLINEAESSVQKAVAILQEGSDLTKQAYIAVTHRAATNAVDNQAITTNNGASQKVRQAAITNLNSKHSQYRNALSVANPYEKIGEAHTALVELVNQPLSPLKSQVFINTLVSLSGNITALQSSFDN